jgi:hypothetical protein
MTRLLIWGVLSSLVTISACDIPDRVGRLEKDTREMRQQMLSDREKAEVFDLQGKCGKDARAWFTENWSRDKDTITLGFIDHYNKRENKCFIVVENHYNSKLAGPGGESWTSHTTVYDVEENSQYAEFAENHYTYYKPTIRTSEEVILCEDRGEKCKSQEEFNTFMRRYMND